MSRNDDSGWVQTFTGRKFWPLDPRPEDIDPTDVAHALGNVCRFAGHCRQFYSVAQHCVYASIYVPKEYALEALLHDAAEAYFADVPRPVKNFIQGFRDIEEKLDRCVAERFGITYPWSKEVTNADNRMLSTERLQLFDKTIPWSSSTGYDPYENLIIAPWSSHSAKLTLTRMLELGIEVG